MPQCVNLTFQEGQKLKSFIDRQEASEQAAEKSNNPVARLGAKISVLTAEEQSLRHQLMTKVFNFGDCKRNAWGPIHDESLKRLAEDIRRIRSYDRSKQPASK